MQRLPSKLKELWEIECKGTPAVVSIDKLVIFIKERAAAVGAGQPIPVLTATEEPWLIVSQDKPSYKQEMRQELMAELKQEMKQERRADKPRYDKGPRYQAAIHVNAPSVGYKYDCIVCAPEKHPLYQCQKFKDMDVKVRKERVRNAKLCFNCFVPGHRNTDCRSSFTCRICSAKHNTLLHQDHESSPQASTNTATSATSSNILMMTANVHITGPGGRKITARALLDSGSTHTFISQKAVQEL